MEIKELLEMHEVEDSVKYAVKLYEDDAYDAAIEACELIIEYSKENPYLIQANTIMMIKFILMSSFMFMTDYNEALIYANDIFLYYCNNRLYLKRRSEILYKLSDIINAEEAAKKAVDISKQQNGTNSPEYVDSLRNYAEILGHGYNIEKAENLFEEAYSIASEIEMHPLDYGFLIRDIGRFYSVNLNSRKALEKFEMAEKIMMTVLDENDVDILGLKNDIACELKELEYTERAIEKFEELLKICIELYGDTSYNTLITKGNLANAYKKNNDFEMAVVMVQQAIDGHYTLNGEQSYDYQRETANYANLLSSMGQHEKSIEIYRRAYELRKKYRGENDKDTLDVLRLIAYEYKTLNKFSDAAIYYKQALPEISIDMKYDFFDCLSLTGLAKCYACMNENEKAIELIEIASCSFDQLEEMLPVIKSEIKKAEIDIALNCLDYAAAEKKSSSVLKSCKRDEKSTDDDINSAIKDHALVLMNCGKYNEAEQLFMEYLYSFKPTKYNSDAAMFLNCNLAVINTELGKMDAAKKFADMAEKYHESVVDDIDHFNYWYMKAVIAKHKNESAYLSEYIEKAREYLAELSGDERSKEKLQVLM